MICSQSCCPASESSSTAAMSREVVSPISLTLVKIRTSSWEPSTYMERIRDG